MRLAWAVRARRDLRKIADDYATLSPGLDDIILERIETAPLVLLDQPRLGPLIGAASLRKWPVRRTPFLLLYRVRREAVGVARIVPAMSDWQSPLA